MTKKKALWISLAAALMVVTQWPPVRSNVSQTYQQVKLILDVLQHVQQQYVEEVDQTKLIYGAAAGMVGSLDPFSQFMEPEVHKEMKIGTSGKFGGLGIRIALRDGWLTVITPLPDTPAYRQGILPGDKIVKIDGESTQGLSLQSAVEKLRGKPKSKVTISIFREGDTEPRDHVIVREIIDTPSVKSMMLSDTVGYIRLAEFIETSVPDLSKSLKDLSKSGMTSLVFDLRNNPGGLLTSAVDTCKLFMGEDKLIVYTEGRAQPRQDFRADAKAPYSGLPLALLVNGGSASGSEIVAGAFQDQKRAIILGAQTFGKASVQSIIALDDGSALRLTTAHYFTPSGRLIHRNEKTQKGGITPDIAIAIPRDIEVKLQAQSQEVYARDQKPHSIVKDEELIKDEVLERAIELLKAQALFEKIQKG